MKINEICSRTEISEAPLDLIARTGILGKNMAYAAHNRAEEAKLYQSLKVPFIANLKKIYDLRSKNPSMGSTAEDFREYVSDYLTPKLVNYNIPTQYDNLLTTAIDNFSTAAAKNPNKFPDQEATKLFDAMYIIEKIQARNYQGQVIGSGSVAKKQTAAPTTASTSSSTKTSSAPAISSETKPIAPGTELSIPGTDVKIKYRAGWYDQSNNLVPSSMYSIFADIVSGAKKWEDLPTDELLKLRRSFGLAESKTKKHR
jgi:hypothetical protein